MNEKPLIAILDDDESMRDATDNLLQSAGFSTATFPDAESFLSSAIRSRAACVVADMRMPGMTGLQMYQQLRARGEQIPTVLITAYPGSSLRTQARQAGITCCLSKPFAPDELLECVHEALGPEFAEGGRKGSS